MSMEAVSLANSSRDALILSFKEAKFSIVEYDPDCHDLRTLSLHYFEEDDMRVSYRYDSTNSFSSYFLFTILFLTGWMVI